MEMKCKCGNADLNEMQVTKNGPHMQLLCKKCAAHIAFVNKKTAERIKTVQK